MNTHADKTINPNSHAVANGMTVRRDAAQEIFQREDNRPETIAQRKIQEVANNSPQVKQLKAVKALANGKKNMQRKEINEDTAAALTMQRMKDGKSEARAREMVGPLNQYDPAPLVGVDQSMRFNDYHAAETWAREVFQSINKQQEMTPILLQRMEDCLVTLDSCIAGRKAIDAVKQDKDHIAYTNGQIQRRIQLASKLAKCKKRLQKALRKPLHHMIAQLQTNKQQARQFKSVQAVPTDDTVNTTKLKENNKDEIVQQDAEPHRKKNTTGLPDNLKSGIEHLSGYSLDDVKVHYNSNKPVQLNALAYAQGTEIHIASGQEKHLPHEANHVVQQAQERVKPAMQMKGGIPVNDDAGMEHDADMMGARALTTPEKPTQRFSAPGNISSLFPLAKIHLSIQRMVDKGLTKGTPVLLGKQNATVLKEERDGYEVTTADEKQQNVTYAELEYHPSRTGEFIVGYSGLEKDEESEQNPISGPGPGGAGVSLKDLPTLGDEELRNGLLRVFSASIVADRTTYDKGIEVVSHMLQMMNDPHWKKIFIHAAAYFIIKDTRIRFYKEKSIKPWRSKHLPEGLWQESRQSVLIASAIKNPVDELARTLIHELTHLVIGSSFKNNESLPYDPYGKDEKIAKAKSELKKIWDEWVSAEKEIPSNHTDLKDAKTKILATITNLLQYPQTALAQKEDVYKAFNREVFSHYSEICHTLRTANIDMRKAATIFPKTAVLFQAVGGMAERPPE